MKECTTHHLLYTIHHKPYTIHHIPHTPYTIHHLTHQTIYRRVDKNIFSCEHPLMAKLPATLHQEMTYLKHDKVGVCTCKYIG
ncbi:hypothetical protein EON63_07095 [archaeon]|nr:MAG: hypothetical protein EON63_07095 [archaeon]